MPSAWYLRYSLSYREVQELLEERDLKVDHTTVWRWVQCYAPQLEDRTRPHLKPTNKSWRVDETYVRIKALLSKSLSDRSHPQPRVINTDKARCYPLAISDAKDRGILRRRCRHRPVAYLNNIPEQDYRAIKKRFVPSSISVVSTARDERSKATRQFTRFEKGKFDGWGRAMFGRRMSLSTASSV